MFSEFKEVEEWLFSKLPVFQNNGASAYKPDINNTRKLLEKLGNPHEKLKFIHIAGTNGKGSVSHALSSILTTSGLKTGLYTSPHLVSFTERIKINGKEVSEQWIINFCNQHKGLADEIQPSFFEFTFAMAIQYFFDNQVDIAVIEVGMGGRLDSTNIIQPLISVITNISLDHVQFLGNTLESIAYEKAGIIKKQTPLIIGEKQTEIEHVFKSKALEMNTIAEYAEDLVEIEYKDSDLFETKGNIIWNSEKYDFVSDLGGEYQKKNLKTIFAVGLKLIKWFPEINLDKILEGLKQVRKKSNFHGRMEKLQEKPLLFLDVAHNEAGVKYLVEIISNHSGKLRIVWGMVADKDAEKIFKILPQDAKYYWVEPSVFRKKPVNILADEAKKHNLKGKICGNVKSGISIALSESQVDDWIVVTGSCFVVADALS